jgi:DNA polymerase I-like protein with 3'-5' exonuclease and polymerase domains
MSVYKLPYTPNYEYITTEDRARKALNYLDGQPVLGVDTETSGKDPLTDKVILVQIGTAQKAYLFDVRQIGAELLAPILESDKHLKLLQYAKFDYQMVKQNHDIRIKRIYDTMLSEQLLHLGMFVKSSLEALVRKYLGFDIEKGLARSFVDRYEAALTKEQLEYAANDVIVLPEIYNQQLAEIERYGLERVCKLEFECVAPVAQMELNGIKLDDVKWMQLSEKVKEERARVAAELSKRLSVTTPQQTLFGVEPINLSSSVQLLRALRSMGFELENTNEGSLKYYKGNEIIDILLKFRELEKAVTSYGETFLKNIHPTTDRIHARYRQLVSTGRFSCSSRFGAGLQQIKKESDFRSCFISEPGYSITTSDYSNMELRIIADYSNDPFWVRAFKENIDMHATTASVAFGVSIEEVLADAELADSNSSKKWYRDKAKAINFGLAYGMSEYGLSKRLNISKDEARRMIKNFFDACRGVKSFLDDSARSAVANQYIETISGRKRFFKLPKFDDPDFDRVRGSIERRGMNTPIQGSNADVIKQAMIYLQNEFDERDLDAKLVHCVHDEVVIENHESLDEEMPEIIERNLHKAWYDFFERVPIKTDTVVRKYWSKK